MKFRVNCSWETLYYIIVIQCIQLVLCSEFPERECCDTLYSSPPNPEPVQPTQPAIITQILPSTITANHTGNKNVLVISN